MPAGGTLDHVFLFSHRIGRKEERAEKERGRIDRGKREEVKLLMEIIYLLVTLTTCNGKNPSFIFLLSLVPTRGVRDYLVLHLPCVPVSFQC